jgi:hypothetical protein
MLHLATLPHAIEHVHFYDATSVRRAVVQAPVSVQALNQPGTRGLLKGLVLQANVMQHELVTLENEILAMGATHIVHELIAVLRDAEATSVELQLATMCLIRLGDEARDAVFRYAMNPRTERDIWLADFLAHQLGLKRIA